MQLGNIDTVASADAAHSLWSSYWTSHPSNEVWHAQTFARMTAPTIPTTNAAEKSSSGSSSSSSSATMWPATLRSHLQAAITSSRARFVRTYFAHQKEKNEKQNIMVLLDAAPGATLSDALDVFTAMCKDQPVLNLRFISKNKSSSSSSGQQLALIFADSSVARRVLVSLAGLADACVAAPITIKNNNNNNTDNLMSSHRLQLRGPNITPQLMSAFGKATFVKMFSDLFQVFGPCSVAAVANNNAQSDSTTTTTAGDAAGLVLSITYQMGAACNKNRTADDTSKALRLAALSPMFCFPAESDGNDAATATTSFAVQEDAAAAAAPTTSDAQFSVPPQQVDLVEYLASDVESALQALVHLQRPLAEDWGMILTFA